MIEKNTSERVVHHHYVADSETHYAGNMAAGALVLGLFGDVATELAIAADGDEGLLAAYERVDFRAPVRGGDILEISGEITEKGHRSRRVDLTASVVSRRTGAASRSERLAQPIVAVTATAVTVVPGK